MQLAILLHHLVRLKSTVFFMMQTGRLSTLYSSLIDLN